MIDYSSMSQDRPGFFGNHSITTGMNNFPFENNNNNNNNANNGNFSYNSSALDNSGSNNINSSVQQQQQQQHQQLQLQLQQQQQQQQAQSMFMPQNQGNTGVLAPHSMAQMFQQQQQPQLQQGLSMSMSDQQQKQSSLNISHEIKRLQQLHQLGMGPTSNSNALLMPNAQLNTDPSNNASSTNALLQSFMDQKMQNSLYDDSLRSSIGNNQGGGTSNLIQPGFLQDSRMLMAQQQNHHHFNMNMNNNTLNSMMPQFSAIQQQQQQQQQQPLNQLQQVQQELPLPSPHSLFHRDGSRRMRGGVIEPFPEKLHRLLLEVEAAGRSDVISFVAGGKAFAIHNPDKFFKEIVPLYFRQSRLSSFKRQLNLYGFELINTGPARGGYYHQLFVKDRPELCRRMRRVAVKVVTKPSVKQDSTSKNNDPSDEKPNNSNIDS